MTYSSGNTILDDDYNGFKDDVNAQWSTGSSDAGYGQSAISAVSAGSTVTATQWGSLLTPMTNAAAHQGTSISPIGNPSVGDTIQAYTTLASNITSITGTNRLNAVASGTDSSVNTTTTSAWSASATTSKTITFASANQLRYFFNAGGMIRMSWSRSGGSATTQNTSWTNLLSATGTIVATGSAASKSINSVFYTGITKIGGSGSENTLNTAYGAVTNYTGTPTTVLKKFTTTYLYTSNFIEVKASVSGAVITYAVTLDDNDSTPGTDQVDGTLTMTTTIRPPSTTYLTNSWGTVSQNSATWTLT
jgi:hypothetical protein